MSLAGQNTFTGISLQADIALYFLLTNIEKSSFLKLTVEAEGWDDFKLDFSDHSENYEVKWHESPLSYSQIGDILDNELTRSYAKEDTFNIVAKRISSTFLKDYHYIRESLYSWASFYGQQDFRKNPVVKKLLEKGWTENKIAFLLKTNILAFQSEEAVGSKISEYFVFKDNFYYPPDDRDGVIAKFFRDVVKAGAEGADIAKQEFLGKIAHIKKAAKNRSDLLNEDKTLGQQKSDLLPFLNSKEELSKLNKDRYLVPLSGTPPLIFDLTERFSNSDFHVHDFKFFIEKILIKRAYIWIAMKLISEKWKQGRVSPEYIIDFLKTNYELLIGETDKWIAMDLLVNVAKADQASEFKGRILNFVDRLLGVSIEIKNRKIVKKWADTTHVKEEIAKLLELYLDASKETPEFLDFIFAHFDLTGDYFQLTVETHPKIYAMLKQFLVSDIRENFSLLLKRICSQYDYRYGLKYSGYEFVGGGVSQAGSHFSITDIGIVRSLFTPAFLELYSKDEASTWRFLKREILGNWKKSPSRKYPVFLFRAAVPVLIQRAASSSISKKERNEARKFLEQLIKIKRGFPSTSEVVFDTLRQRDNADLGNDFLMKLIDVDSRKYRSKPGEERPTTLFVITLLFQLIKTGYAPAREFLLRLLRNQHFPEWDQHYDTFEQLSTSGLLEEHPDLMLEMLEAAKFSEYLSKVEGDIVWDKTDALVALIGSNWKRNESTGTTLLKNFIRAPGSPKVLEFASSVVSKLTKIDAIKTYNMVEEFLISKAVFKRSFPGKFFRETIADLGYELAGKNFYNEAIKIGELCLDDPDPETSNEPDDFNYHLQVKSGKDVSLITSVRGKTAWLAQRLIASNDPGHMQTAFRMTQTLLDLDGSLSKRLGYPEPDLYIRLEALVPLMELAHPWRRKTLGEGFDVKKLALSVVAQAIVDTEKGYKLTAILDRLVHVFSNMRDLGTEDAKRLLMLFEQNSTEDAHFLFMYFAVFRETQSLDIPFDPAWFKEKLKSLCSTANVFRRNIAFAIWEMAKDKFANKSDGFDRMGEYWKTLADVYDREVFNQLYSILEILLGAQDDPSDYALLQRAIDKEAEALRGLNDVEPIWGPKKEIAEILVTKDPNRFAETFLKILDGMGTKTHYYSLVDWRTIYKGLDKSLIKNKELPLRIEQRLFDLGYID